MSFPPYFPRDYESRTNGNGRRSKWKFSWKQSSRVGSVTMICWYVWLISLALCPHLLAVKGACTHASRSISKLIRWAPCTSIACSFAVVVGRWESEPGMNHPFLRILCGPSLARVRAQLFGCRRTTTRYRPYLLCLVYQKFLDFSLNWIFKHKYSVLNIDKKDN